MFVDIWCWMCVWWRELHREGSAFTERQLPFHPTVLPSSFYLCFPTLPLTISCTLMSYPCSTMHRWFQRCWSPPCDCCIYTYRAAPYLYYSGSDNTWTLFYLFILFIFFTKQKMQWEVFVASSWVLEPHLWSFLMNVWLLLEVKHSI